MTTPRAFISHAVEDNDRFARGFVERLRANGVEAWKRASGSLTCSS